MGLRHIKAAIKLEEEIVQIASTFAKANNSRLQLL
jgi:hypothetical protein